MSQRFRGHRGFAIWALVALGVMVAAVGSSVLVLVDSHQRFAPVVGGHVVGTPDSEDPLEGVPCFACFLRAQLEGSDLSVTGDLRIADAVPEPLPSLGRRSLALLLGPALVARGPPPASLLLA